MIELKVKTRGDSSPSGKSKVYFSCCPTDFEHCFEVLSKKIFQIKNCAIYYLDDLNISVEDLGTVLKEMQLFVIPITMDYLFKPNIAREFEFGFAIENCIPVFPIIMETNADKYFSKQMELVKKGYGDIQFLNYIINASAQGLFWEKFEYKINSVLGGEEMIKRIQNDFRAYIFLSYRKKDREYAEKLKKLIHKISFCWDIAIWYDEYLVPGEQWTISLEKQITDSDVMLLVITPHILESDNYVLKHEYPSACSNRKKIIPIQVISTDAHELNMLFPDIGKVIDVTDEKMLEIEMANAFSEIKLRDNSPEHCFVMGLAYLDGIYVERNLEKAEKLISFAANNKCPEACGKLVSMYENGKGVKRNYLEAIQWREKQLKYYQENFLQKCNEMNYEKLFDAWISLGIAQKDQNENVAAKSSFFEANQLALYAEQKGFCRSSRDLVVSYGSCGQMLLFEHNYESAIKYYSKAITVIESLEKEGRVTEVNFQLPILYRDVAIIELKRENYDDAKYYCEKCLGIYETIIGDYKGEVEGDIALIYKALAEISKVDKNNRDVKSYLLKCLEIYYYIAREEGTEKALLDLADIYVWLGNVEESETVELEYYKKAYEIMEMIVYSINNPHVWDEFADICFLIGNRDARKYLHEALEIWEKLSEKYPHKCDYKEKVARTIIRIGWCDINSMDDYDYDDEDAWFWSDDLF